MQVKPIIDKLKASSEFKDWHKENPDSFLVHVFMMFEPGAPLCFDIGFYDEKKEVMTSFSVDKELTNIQLCQDKEVFKKEDDKILQLDESKVSVTFDEAQKTAKALQEKEYKEHAPIKEVVILQHLAVGQVWNITYITKSFKTLNMKVDAATGKVLEHKLHEIFSMG